MCRQGAAFAGIQLGGQLQASRQGLVFEGMWQMKQVLVKVLPVLSAAPELNQVLMRPGCLLPRSAHRGSLPQCLPAALWCSDHENSRAAVKLVATTQVIQRKQKECVRAGGQLVPSQAVTGKALAHANLLRCLHYAVRDGLRPHGALLVLCPRHPTIQQKSESSACWCRAAPWLVHGNNCVWQALLQGELHSSVLRGQ